MSDLKKLTGKTGFEQVVQRLVNEPDVALFKELVESDAFLFDFVKQNVAKRIALAVNDDNWRNLMAFLPYYSPSYEDIIVSNFTARADEDLTDVMLDLLAKDNAYAAKYFSVIKDSLALPVLREKAYCEREGLAFNAAQALASQGDRESYDEALEKLKSNDEFEALAATKFLVAYGDKSAAPALVEAMKKSSLSENIAGQIPYLTRIVDLPEQDALLVLNNIINGLGEIFGLGCVFDFELYDVLDYFAKKDCSVVILNAIHKFEILTENDEYLFDEDKNTQNEVQEIAQMLSRINKKSCKLDKYLDEDSPFIYTALDYALDPVKVKELLKSNNQTIILKSIEVLKTLGALDEGAKTVALLKVTDDNIKSIIRAL
jgi:hypothetical protein